MDIASACHSRERLARNVSFPDLRLEPEWRCGEHFCLGSCHVINGPDPTRTGRLQHPRLYGARVRAVRGRLPAIHSAPRAVPPVADRHERSSTVRRPERYNRPPHAEETRPSLTSVSSTVSVTPADRLGLTVCLAIIVHAIVILGITFTPTDKRKPRFDAMEIILVQQKSVAPPEDVDYLAQTNLEGGGESDTKESAAAPLRAPFPAPQPEITAPPPTAAHPPVREAPPQPEELSPQPPPRHEVRQLATESTTPEIPEPVENNKPDQKIENTDPTVTQIEKAKTEPRPKPIASSKTLLTETRPAPSAAALISNSFAIASLSAEIKRKLAIKAKRPKRKFISASTKEYKYAAYMEAWRSKVERIGNLNYPDDARKRKLSGSLILEVALNPDGTVNQITIRRPSRYKILDDAAIRIVRLAAPFSPFPEGIREDVDILHITRTWQFLSSQRLLSK